MTGKDIYSLYERLAQLRELDPDIARLILRKILDIIGTGKVPLTDATAKNERENDS